MVRLIKKKSEKNESSLACHKNNVQNDVENIHKSEAGRDFGTRLVRGHGAAR